MTGPETGRVIRAVFKSDPALPLPGTGGLLMTMLPGGNEWRLDAPETFRLPIPRPPGWEGYADELRTGETTIIVPAGFVTDFASVPGWAQSFVSRVGKHARAALLHDFLYENRIGSRKVADWVFREQMRRDGVVWLRRWLAWLAVRVGGKHTWDT